MKVKANQINANCTEMTFGSKNYLQSYNTIVGMRENGKITLDPNHNRSVTTSKHVTLWLGIDSKKRAKMIELKIIKIKSLN